MFIKVTNNQTENYTVEQLRRDNAQVSFPQDIPETTLAEYNVFPLKSTPIPAYDERMQRVDVADPVYGDQGWAQAWVVQDKTEAELAAETEAQTAQIRSERNVKLTISDWTQVLDAPVDQAAWAAYRQALRDITAQDGFPWDVTWPETP